MKTKSKYKFSPFQKAWIDALISQKYKKTIGRLAKVDKKGNLSCCCLGVACEIASKFLDSHLNKNKSNPNDIEYNGVGGCLPINVEQSLRLRSCSGAFRRAVGKKTNLAKLNDCAKWSHKKIGEYIRDNPENVFCNAGKET